MSAATWIDPLAGGATANGSTTWLGVLFDWLRAKTLPPTQPPHPEQLALLESMKRAAGALGAPLLEATSRDDLDERLEQAIVRPELGRFDGEAGRLLTIDTLTSIAARSEPPEEMIRTLGAGPAAIVVGSGRLHTALASVLVQILVECGPTALSQDEFDVVAFVTKAGVHSTIKRCVVQGLRSSVALLGLVHALVEGNRPAPWLSLALAEVFRDGLYDSMRYLASLPVHVPIDLVPLADRFDLQALQNEIAVAEFEWQMGGDANGELHSCEVPDDDS
jgi:hypothetical protein